MEKEKARAGVSSALGELPTVARARLKARAFWELCPPWAQGALAWAALSPWTASVWAALTRVDPMGGYQIKWGPFHMVCAWWLVGLAISCAALPLSRAMVGLARGAVASWAGFLAELKGVDAATGRAGPARAAAWALFGWAWIGGLGVSWLQERGARVDGGTLGKSLPWHMWNGARAEVVVLIFACFALAALRLKMAPGAPLSWGVAWRALRDGAGQAPGAARAGVSSWGRDWARAKSKGGAMSALRSAWEAAPFGARQLISAGAAVSLCWLVGRQLAQRLDPAWVLVQDSEQSGWTLCAMAWLCAMIAGICSRDSGGAPRRGLWFGPDGPGVAAWARFGVAGLAFERAMAWRAHADALCSDASLSQGGVLAVVCGWAALVYGIEAMGWLGGVFEAWEREALLRGPRGIEGYVGAACFELRSWWRAAAGGAARLGEAVERRALENGLDIALAQRSELEEEIEVPKARAERRSGRL